MPPPAGGKRKRPERGYSDDHNSGRPSPHRPQNLGLAQSGYQPNDRDYNQQRGRGGRRSSRGGRGASIASSPVNSPGERPPAPHRIPPADPQPSITNEAMSTTQEAALEPADLSDPPPETQPYNYTYLTIEICDSWQSGGREDVLRQGLEGMQDEEGTQLTALMQELVQSSVFGRLGPLDAGDLVKQMLESEISDDDEQSAPRPTALQAALLDSVSVMFENNPNIPLDRLSAFVLASEISHVLLRQELDAVLLEKFYMIRNTFSRMGIRKQTNLLYRQANFNLMREESEGFAKLMTELFTTSSSEAPTASTVADTVENVKAMIGAFDLDVGRSLDVVLDVFSAVLVKQCRFFVKFLRSSPWWPRSSAMAKKASALSGLPLWALPGSSEWHLTPEQEKAVSQETSLRDQAFWHDARDRGLQAFYLLGGSRSSKEHLERASTSGDELLMQWVQETGTLPPPGNRDAAQLLGFKLRFYSSSSARDDTDILPDNLIYLSALLIKIGFVSLKDLYPHIWRTDNTMDELKEQKIKEKQDREAAARPGAGVRNALASAGALADDTLPASSRVKESTTRANTPSREPDADKRITIENDLVDQKVLLLKSLLAVGALPEALFILGRFPWLMDLIPELPEYIHRILHHSLTKVYGEVQPLQQRPSLRSQKPSYETDVPGVAKGQARVVESAERKVLRWAQLDRNDSPDGTDYRFYWDEWNDNVPVCQDVDDVFTLCNTFLPLVGVKIGQDVGLLLKFARIGKHSLQTDQSETNRSRWLDLIKRVLLPSLSLTKSNAGVINEVFELVSLFPVSIRYLMYLEWSSGRTSRNPDIKAAFDQARAETKDILKRISNTNVRPMARSLAKIAFANPHIVISTALTQIEVYDSIAEVFVEGARYFTDLGYDVLTWAIVTSMAKTGRNRTQDGGLFASRWLSALSIFAGKIYKRYGMMKPGPILQYVAEQLDHGNTMDMKMLEQIVMSMAGISTDTSYNDAQLQAMGGGSLLQGQIILQLLDRRHDSKRTSERLIKSLQDTGLAAKFLISMAQQRQAVVFEDGEVPLKAIGNTYDEVHRVMVQYLDLLRTNLSPDEFRATIPTVISLLVDYEIRPEIAFWISRPLIFRQMQDYDMEHRKLSHSDEVKHINGDIEMTEQLSGGSEEDGEAVEIEDVMANSPSIDDTNIPTPDLEHSAKTPDPSEAASDDCWHPVMKDLMTAIKPSLSDDIVDVIGTGFYTTFWQLSLYEIVVPLPAYKDEKARLERKSEVVSADRTDVSVSGTKKKELASQQIKELVARLDLELTQHMKDYLDGKARLHREKEQWFVGKTRMDRALNTALIEHCFLPRLLSSPLDAYFCFKFLKILHGGGTPNFRTLGFYDLFFRTSRLISLIFLCTSKEADNLGKFLNEVLKDLGRWHESKATYEREGCGIKKNLPGFAMKIEAGRVVALLDFENFQKILFKWHSNVYTALQKCLTSPEYMHVRNAISVLRVISATYPSVNSHGVGLQKAVDKLRDSDKEDLKVSSQALLGALHRREKVWVEAAKFRKGPEKKEEIEQETSPSKTALSQEDASSTQPTKQEGNIPAKDEATTTVSLRSQAKPAPEQNSSAVLSRSSRLQPTAEPFRSSRHAPTPATTNGALTPSRQGTEASPAPTRESRPTRQEPTKPHELPRRLSPPSSSRSNPAGLPSRPEPLDARNGHRDSPRQSQRPDIESSRPSSEARTNQTRDSRPGHRVLERADHQFEEYDRHSRRYDRPEGPPYPGREERGYAREHERRGPYDRPPIQERDRPPVRPPPPGRERENRESAPRPRPAPVSEPLRPDSQTSQRREAPSEPSINPARASLIESGDQRPSASSRSQGPEKSTRSSRPSSPRREDERKPTSRRDIDDRTRPDSSSMRQPHGPSAVETTTSTARPDGIAPPRRELRESRPPPTVDMQHGRLEQEPSARAPSVQNLDRPPESDVPSGPRSRAPPTANGPRMRAPALNTQVSPTSAAERPTPTGPSRRQHGRSGSYAEAPVTPSTPAADSAGVHPSRLSMIDAVAPDSSRPSQSSQAPQQNHPPAGPRGNAPGGNAPPGAPLGPSPTSRGPPSGPHSGDPSARGGRTQRNQLAGINNTLASAGASAGTSVRGRGNSRQNSANFAPHMPPPPPPPPGGPPPSSHGNTNGYPPTDLFSSSNPNELPVASRPSSARNDNIRGDRRSEMGDDGGSERRTSRHSSRHDDSRGERQVVSERDSRESKDERYSGSSSSRREERPTRRENQPPDADERRGGHPRSGVREETQASRKHGREDESGGYGRGPGSGGGSGGRGGSRVASEKRVRRGP